MSARSTLLAATAALLVAVPVAAATPMAATLTGFDGEGTFDGTIGCPAGDGPSWHYAFAGRSTPITGPVAADWSSRFEIHDTGAGRGFVSAGTSRISLALDRGGTAAFKVEGVGDCDGGPLAFGVNALGDRTVSGVLPITAEFGTQAARGLTGSGTATVALELGPGADNDATIQLSGDFDVRDPNLAIVGASARWNRMTDYLQKRLTVYVTIANRSAEPLPGIAYSTRLVSATVPGGSVTGLPANAGTIAPGESRTVSFILNNAQPNKSYSLTSTVDASDGLDAAVAPVVGAASFKSPLLFP